MAEAQVSRLPSILADCADLRPVLEAVRSLDLPDWAVGAGYIRSMVWDSLLGRASRTTVDDIDVLYFDAGEIDPATDERLDRALRRRLPLLPWSVRNQARMHRRNGDRPYRDTAHAVAHWLETPTCVAVRLTASDALEVIAPFGLDDLFALRIRPTPRGREKPEEYRDRLQRKRWPERWPGVTAEEL